jgi:hypothetical protein
MHAAPVRGVHTPHTPRATHQQQAVQALVWHVCAKVGWQVGEGVKVNRLAAAGAGLLLPGVEGRTTATVGQRASACVG